MSIVWWLFDNFGDIITEPLRSSFFAVMAISALYFCSHLLRMTRLALLTLDERDNIFPLLTAHAITAFPASLLPFKLGEIIRLSSFYVVFGGKQKAFAVWLAERFGDVCVLILFILGLNLFNIPVSESMRNFCIVFVLLSVAIFSTFFVISKTAVYLNRYLVLTSKSPRGLMLLRLFHQVRSFESYIHKTVEGRFSGLIFTSVMIWAVEILSLSIFIHLFNQQESDWLSLFSKGLFASLAGDNSVTYGFGLYQTFALMFLACCFVIPIIVIGALKTNKVKYD
jgi:hypothetical protein